MQNYNPTRLNELFAYLENTVNSDSVLHQAVKLYMDAEREFYKKEHDGPFLTVVTRTQGKRREMLNEMLLCLTGQSNTDFEFILAGHNLDEDGQKCVNELIDELPQWMKDKTTYLPISGGTRTTPLIKAFDIAKGRYIAVLDDDDIVFDNWVEAFYETACENPGKILHSYSVRQDWETVGQTQIPRCVDAPSNIYCKDFQFIREFVVNVCPLMSLAFPSYAYKTLGIKFDESLTTTEDWDFLMRTACITGVANNSAITSVYRFWDNAESSQTLHNKKEWDNNYEKIVTRFKQSPKVLNGKEFFECVKILTKGIRPTDLYAKANAQEAELFFDDGAGFTAGRSIKGNAYEGDENWALYFDNFDNIGKISALRFDPQELGGIAIDSIAFKIVYQDGSEENISQKRLRHNGFVLDNQIVFIKSDPQFIFSLSKAQKIKAVYVNFNLLENIPDTAYDVFLKPYERKQNGIFLRAFRLFKKVVKKIIRK